MRSAARARDSNAGFLKRGLVMFFFENVGDFGHPMNLAIIPIIDIVVWFVTLKRELQCIKQQCHSSVGPLGLSCWKLWATNL